MRSSTIRLACAHRVLRNFPSTAAMKREPNPEKKYKYVTYDGDMGCVHSDMYVYKDDDFEQWLEDQHKGVLVWSQQGPGEGYFYYAPPK